MLRQQYEANNSDDFLRLVKEKVGREVLIIDGNKEAEYIYKGVSLCHQFDSNAMIMDIGGGKHKNLLRLIKVVCKA